MILKPDEIQKRFGKLFAQRFFVMVDEKHQCAELIERCMVRGTVEWDVVNRCRGGGVVEWCRVLGNTMIMRAKLGELPTQFGPADIAHGGQALDGVLKNGDYVETKWTGIGGAGIGVAACLAQAPGVISASYPSEDDLKVGGARANRVTITSPMLIFNSETNFLKNKIKILLLFVCGYVSKKRASVKKLWVTR